MVRKLLRGLGCLLYLATLAAVFAVVSWLAFSQFVTRGVTPTPDLGGLPEDQARALLADQGLRLEVSPRDDRYDERVPAAHVLAQQPTAGTLVKRGSPVEVALSRGPQRIEVPKVTGEALQAAQVTLQAAGLTVGHTMGIYRHGSEPGVVVAQVPATGERVEPGAGIDVFLARDDPGDAYVMPDLVTRDYDQVRRFLEGRDFRIGRVSYEDYAGLAPGTVVRQFPQAGHRLRHSDVISLGVVAPDAETLAAATTPLNQETPE